MSNRKELSPQSTEGCVEHANKHQDWRDIMEIYARHLTEGERRRVGQQWAHQNHVNEKQKARNLSNCVIVSLLEVRIAAAIKKEFIDRGRSSLGSIKLTRRSRGHGTPAGRRSLRST